ncbi:MAG: hypothetical protein Q8Q65_00685 [bacterium]|nr:hypothetical protein [bacterium]
MAVSKNIPLIEKDRLLLALRRLNMIIPNKLPVISMYLTINGGGGKNVEAIAFVDSEWNKLKTELAKLNINPEPMDKEIERVKEFIEFSSGDGAKGLAVYVSGYRDIFLTYPIDYSFINKISMGLDFDRAPLIQLFAEQPKEIFITLYPGRSRLYSYSDSMLVEIEPPVIPQDPKQDLKEYMRVVKDAYWPYFRSSDVKSVFLLGHAESMHLFKGVLAKTAVQKVRDMVSLPLRATMARINKESRRLISEHNVLQPQQKVEHAKSLVQRHMAVFGPEAVFRALREGRAREILVDPGFHPTGYVCERCQLLEIRKLDACSLCFNTLTPTTKVKPYVLKLAMEYEALVDKVANQYLRTEGKGIASILRFA